MNVLADAALPGPSEPPLVKGWACAFAAARPWSPPVDLDAALVVVPHPDDEAVLFGGLLARLAARGTQIVLLAVTDGDGAYPGHVDGEDLARVRRREQRQSVRTLGIRGHASCRLGIGDGQVADHEGRVERAIVRMLGEPKIGAVIAPWQHDHHTDHEACGRAVRRATMVIDRPVLIVGGLFWAPQRDPWNGTPVRALRLGADERRRKWRAIECHRSQLEPPAAGVEPVLGPRELALSDDVVERYVIEHVGGDR